MAKLGYDLSMLLWFYSNRLYTSSITQLAELMYNHSAGKLTCCAFHKVTVSVLYPELLEKEGKASVYQHLSKKQGTCKEGKRLLLFCYFPRFVSCMYSVVVFTIRNNISCS